MIGLKKRSFGPFISILLLANFVALSLGLAVSALASTNELAITIGIPCVTLGVFFGGFYINVNSLPIIANWMPYISYYKWGFEALMVKS
jgi:ABC-type multidrug transport system permease subunit